MKIKWSVTISTFISTTLEAVLRGERAASDDELKVARASNALPVYIDFGGALAFTAEGSVLLYDWGLGQISPENDERWIIVAAVAGAEKYPELRAVLPDKPPTAMTCPLCSGRGKRSLTPIFGARCEKCFGLGWLP
jgi:hypothetical protein